MAETTKLLEEGTEDESGPKRVCRLSWPIVGAGCILSAFCSVAAFAFITSRDENNQEKICDGAFVIWLWQILVLGFVLFFPETAIETGKNILYKITTNSWAWPEGKLYKNLEVWAVQDRGPVFPSITDNLASCLTFVIGPRPSLLFSTVIITLIVRWTGRLEFHQPVQSLPLALNATALCDQFGFTPFPYEFSIAKIVATCWFQDMVFGTGDQWAKRTKPLGASTTFFLVYQFFTVFVTYIKASTFAASEEFGESLWERYTAWCFFTGQSASTISMLLLIVKMLCQTNTNDTGAPPGLGRPDRWQLPGFDYPQAKVFWISMAFFASGSLMPLLTHALPVAVLMIVGFFFAVWSLPLLLLWCTPQFHDIAYKALVFGATFQAQVCEFCAVMMCLTIAGVYARKWLWEIQSRVYTLGYETKPLKIGETFTCKRVGEGTTFKTGMWTATIVDIVEKNQRSDNEYVIEWKDGAKDDTIKREKDFLIIRGPEPNGPYGFNTACYSILFSTPIICVLTSLHTVAWTSLLANYQDAFPLSLSLMGELQSRQNAAHGLCLFEQAEKSADKFLGHHLMNKFFNWAVLF